MDKQAKQRIVPVRLDALSNGGRWCVRLVGIFAVALFGIIGLVGPEMLIRRAPVNGVGTGVSISRETPNIKFPANVCGVDLLGTPYKEVKKNCWAHSFSFHNKYTNYFGLDMVPMRAAEYANFSRLESVIDLDITLYGMYDDMEDHPELIADERVKRTVICEGVGNEECKQLLIFQMAHVSYDRYRVMLQIPEDTIDAAYFINTTDIYFTYENKEFAELAIIMKYMFVGITLLLVYGYWWYTNSNMRTPASAQPNNESIHQSSMINLPSWCKRLSCGCFCGPRACPYTSAEPKWITAIVLSTIFFNNPFAVLDYSKDQGTRRAGEVLAVISQFSFICIILLYWLVSFDGLLRTPPFSPRFYATKIFFCGSFWLTGVSTYGWIVVNSINHPLYNWYEDNTHRVMVENVLFVFGVVYLLWVTLLVLRGAEELKNMGRRASFVYIQHLWRLIIVVLGVVYGSTFELNVTSSFTLLLFHAVPTFYAWELVYLYTPIHLPDVYSENNAILSLGEQGGEASDVEGEQGFGSSNSFSTNSSGSSSSYAVARPAEVVPNPNTFNVIVDVELNSAEV